MKNKPEFTVVRGTHVSEFERRATPPQKKSLPRWARLLVLVAFLVYLFLVINFIRIAVFYVIDALR